MLLSGLTIMHSYVGDVILADQGFTCDDYARMMLAEVKTPPFTKGKSQLEKLEIDLSRELSLVRIRYQSFETKVRYFTRCTTHQPISGGDEGLSTLDKIVRVSCSLVNLCPVVPQD